MASDREYLQFILGQLSGLEDITYRAMMGEYIIYYHGCILNVLPYKVLSQVIATRIAGRSTGVKRSIHYGKE